ncbi:ATP-grasp domain-containing protein [Clostridium paraputrificum]
MYNVSRKSHYEAARRYGARLILFMKNPTWEREYVDLAIDVDTENLENTRKAVLELMKTEKIDGVIPFTEHSVPAAAAAAHVLGVPFISEETANICRNKYLMRKAFLERSIPCPKFEIAKTIDEAKNICENFNYPIILKPLIGGGSLAVRRINNEEELIYYFEILQKMALEEFEYDPLYKRTIEEFGDSMLIESYIPGKEVSVESITVDGKTTILAIHDKRLPMQGPYFEELYFSTPSLYNEEIKSKLCYLTKEANKALNIKIGATHTEFRIDELGNVIIVETGARIGGGGIYKSVLSSTGIDMVDCIMDLSIGKKPKLDFINAKPIGFYNFFSEGEGTIKDIKGLDEIRANEKLVELIMYKNIGDKVYMPPNSIAHGHFTVKGDTIDDVDKEVEKMLKTIKIELV